MALIFSPENNARAAEAWAVWQLREQMAKDVRKEKRHRLRFDYDFQRAEFLKATSDFFPRYLESKGVFYRKDGRRACPFHNGDNPSGSHFYFEKGVGYFIAHCHTGHCKPKVTDFINAVCILDGVDYTTAVRRIAEMAGVPLPEFCKRR